jgi:hypothetical protein
MTWMIGDELELLSVALAEPVDVLVRAVPMAWICARASHPA